MSDESQGSSEQGKKTFDWTFVKGFTAGLVISNINKHLILGLIIGTLSGFYIEQNFKNIPHVKSEAVKILAMAKEAVNKGKRDE